MIDLLILLAAMTTVFLLSYGVACLWHWFDNRPKTQPVELYVSPYADWKTEHTAWMRAHGLEPLTYKH